jgi:hypothetical protein
MLTYNNKPVTQKEKTAETTNDKFYNSSKKVDSKGMSVYTTKGYGVIAEEVDNEGNVKVKIDNKEPE